MSENQNNTRLLKANNVQRRFYVKEVEALTSRAASKARNDADHKKAVVYNHHVQKAMGAELEKLLNIRASIQAHKQAILELQTCEAVRRRLNKRGLKSDVNDHYGRINDALDFYTRPPATDKKSEDVCQVIVGNPMVQLRMMECSNNPPYAEYEESILSIESNTDNYREAQDTLRRQIWGVVSTDEILDLIEQFKKEWL